MADMKKWWMRLLAVTMMVGILAQPVPVRTAQNEYYIKVNRQQNCVTVYEKDANGKYTVPVKAFACSTGVNNATPKGTFKLGQKYRWRELDGHVYGQYSTRITGRVLFHSVYYHTTDPSTLYYGAYNQLGTSVSHGCVRLCVADAKWIFDNCETGTTVEIYDGDDPGPLGKPNTVRISSRDSNRGWDPTDPDPGNPWKLSAPKITCAKELILERGSAREELLNGVKATDFAGNAVKLTVSGGYNLNKTGKYKIIYKAVDSLGNQGEKQVTLTVRDTKAPTVRLTQKKLKLTDKTGEFLTAAVLKSYLKQYATAWDGSEQLADKHIRIDAKELWKAWKKRNYGIYEVIVYAADAAGNRSAEKILTVRYVDETETVSE